MYLQVVGRSRYKHVIWIYWIQLYLFFHFHEHHKTEKNINIVVLNACLCLQDMLTLVCCFWLTFFIKQRFRLTLNLYKPGTLKCGHDSSGGWETLFDAKNRKDLALFQCSASLCILIHHLLWKYLSKTTFLYKIKLMNCNH